MNSYVNKFYHLTVTTVQSIHWNMQCGFSYLTVIIYSDKLTCCCKSGTCNSFWDLHAIRPCWDNLIVTCSMFLHEVCVHLPEVCEKTEGKYFPVQSEQITRLIRHYVAFGLSSPLFLALCSSSDFIPFTLPQSWSCQQGRRELL